MYNTFEGGTADSPITVANSGPGSGDAFSFIIVQGANAGAGSANAKYVDDWTEGDGELSLLFTLGASSCYVGWTETEVADRYVAEWPIFAPSTPTATVVEATIRNASGMMAEARMTTARVVQVNDPSGLVPGTSSPALTAGVKYIGQLAVTRETGAGGNGLVELRILSADRSTVVYSSTAAANRATGTSPVAQYRIGGATTASGWTQLRLDNVQAKALASGWPTSIGAPPTVNATTGGRYIVDLRGSTDPDGTPTYACTVNGGLTVDEVVDGYFVVTQDATAHSLTFTVTQGSDVIPFVHEVPALSAGGGAPDSLRRRRFTGGVLLPA